MSSTRDYGLRIQNAGKQNCYPTESPITPFFNNTTNCNRAQLWMAAVRLDVNGVMQGIDVSYPAFWLPFQDLGTNNHLAQWAQESFTGTCAMPDAGVSEAGACAPGLCCDNGGCAPCPNPPPPAATCSSNANCASGQCCVNAACAACAGSDAGTIDAATGDAGPPPPGCNTCLDCQGQACNGGACGSCSSSSDCCAPLTCLNGSCQPPIR